MKPFYLFLLNIFLFMGCLSGTSSHGETTDSDQVIEQNEQIVEITGLVKRRGNVPHSYLTITDDNGESYAFIENEASERLGREYQNRRVKVRGLVFEDHGTFPVLPKIEVMDFEIIE